MGRFPFIKNGHNVNVKIFAMCLKLQGLEAFGEVELFKVRFSSE